MPTVLEGIRESHDGPEPRVRTSDVQAILRAVTRAADDSGKTVALIAERSGYSTRTVYRVIQGDKPTLKLELADALVTAAGHHLASCFLVWPDGSETSYVSLDRV